MIYLLSFYYINISHFHNKLLVLFAHKNEVLRRKPKHTATPKPHFEILPSMYTWDVYWATWSQKRKNTKPGMHFIQLVLVQFIRGMRRGVNFHVLSLGSHTSHLGQVGCAFWQAVQEAVCFNFTCLDRAFSCPILAVSVRFNTLILSCCAEFTWERTPAAWEHGFSGSCKCRAPLRSWTSVMDRSSTAWCTGLLQSLSGFQYFGIVDFQWALGSF